MYSPIHHDQHFSIDTIKTRIQGQPYPQKYTGFLPAYRTVFVEEGFRRGLYGGWVPAMIGSCKLIDSCYTCITTDHTIILHASIGNNDLFWILRMDKAKSY